MSALQFIDVNASARIDWYSKVSPHDNVVKGLWLPRENTVKAKRNLANAPTGSRDGVVVGVPTFTASHMSSKSYLNYVLSDVAETADMTMVVIARSTDLGTSNPERPTFIGNYDGPSGSMIYLTNGAGGRYVRGQGINGAGTNTTRVLLVESTITSWAMYALVLSTTTITIYDLTNGTSSTLAMAGRTVSPKLISVGSVRSLAFSDGDCDIAGALVANVAATPTQLADWRAMFNIELNPYSITI